ncbi:MAG: ORF6N domain-containing protein [Bacteroidales bacterium]|nr:ORF6N domain-containing protein [Bacteroidales bacterium]
MCNFFFSTYVFRSNFLPQSDSRVTTKRLNEQVKRNLERFPDRFRFQLSSMELNELVANCDRLKTLKHSSVQPYAFTEQGIAMLSTVLHSVTAIAISIQIMDAFVAMRHLVASNAKIFQRLSNIEQNQLALAVRQNNTDNKLAEVFKRLDSENTQTQQGIFFDGQVFDAYTLVSDLIRSAKSRIILFDNYVDDSVLAMLDKRADDVSAQIYTRNISRKLSLDLQRHNAQYRPITVSIFSNAHDRFLCIDETVYHVGASLKDLGKKWFAFNKMEVKTKMLMDKMKDI